MRMEWRCMDMDTLTTKVGNKRRAKQAAYADIVCAKVEAGHAYKRYMLEG